MGELIRAKAILGWVESHHHAGHVIARAAAKGGADKDVGPFLRVGVLARAGDKIVFGDMIGEAIATQQQAIAGL